MYRLWRRSIGALVAHKHFISYSLKAVLAFLVMIFGGGLFSFNLILVAWFCTILFVAFGVGGGCHRLLVHNKGKNRLEKPLVFLSVMYGIGSPILWACNDNMHHRHENTNKDPHLRKSRKGDYQIWEGPFMQIKCDIDLIKLYLRDSFYKNLHEKEFWMWMSFVLILSMVGVEYVLAVWAIPFLIYYVVYFLLTARAHRFVQIRDVSLLFYPFVFADVFHCDHHKNPSNLIYNKYDIVGYLLSVLFKK